MVNRVAFKPHTKLYEDYYCNQAGNGLPVFVGGRNYRGRGLGSFLGGIGRAIVPLLKSGGKALLKEGARTGMEIAQDVLSGRNVSSAFKERAQEAGKRLLTQSINHVTGQGLQAPPRQPAAKRIKSTPMFNKRHSKQRRRGGRVGDIFSK